MTQSAQLPVTSTPIVFSKKIEGAYGTFRTDKSFETAFLVATLPMSRIEELGTASESFPISEVDFEDLIQRDIDMERVTRIQSEYLQGTVNKVVFFPPLLVAVMPYDHPTGSSDLSIPTVYESFQEQVAEGWIEKTWDETRFQVRIPIAPSETGLKASCLGATYPIYPYAAELKLNPDRTRLVVIDGQHRLSALRGLYKNIQTRHVVANIDVPICLIYSPNALLDNIRGERLKDNLRELFVTINDTARQVSGHFIVLLNDDALTSLSVRSLSQVWKESSTPQGFSKLHLLDWNQRRTELVLKRTKQISITTVSIIADALEREIFAPDLSESFPASFLNLESVRVELEELAEDFPVDQIRDDCFHPKQKTVLESQIASSLTPALDVLLSVPRPYEAHQARVGKAIEWLDSKVMENIDGAKAYRDEVLANFRSANNCLDSVKTIEKSFQKQCEPDADDSVFFLNVFQDALLTLWADLSKQAIAFDLTPTESANLAVLALSDVFVPNPSLLAKDQIFNNLTLYRSSGSVMYNEAAKEQWRRLLAISLLGTDAKTRILDWCILKLGVDGGSELSNRVREMAESANDEFFAAMERSVQRDMEKSWFDRQIDQAVFNQLELLRTQFGPRSTELKAAIEDGVTKPRILAARDALGALLS